MILVDAGPLFGLLHRGDAAHERCVAALDSLTGPLLTTWPAFTEAMYLLRSVAGWRAQQPLWGLVESGRLQVATLPGDALPRMASLMAQYQDLPMDLADASLVAYAERHAHRRIFTLDHHFRVYRLPNGQLFDVVP